MNQNQDKHSTYVDKIYIKEFPSRLKHRRYEHGNSPVSMVGGWEDGSLEICVGLTVASNLATENGGCFVVTV